MDAHRPWPSPFDCSTRTERFSLADIDHGAHGDGDSGHPLSRRIPRKARSALGEHHARGFPISFVDRHRAVGCGCLAERRIVMGGKWPNKPPGANSRRASLRRFGHLEAAAVAQAQR